MQGWLRGRVEIEPYELALRIEPFRRRAKLMESRLKVWHVNIDELKDVIGVLPELVRGRHSEDAFNLG